MTGLLTFFRSMNRFALVAGLGASVALGGPALASAQDDGGAYAREHRGHHRRGGAHFGRMAGELGLTAAQQQQMRSVMAQAREERQALRELPPEERRAAAREMRQRMRAEMQAILTPEQQERARELRAEHRERRFERRIERMQERLGLSDQQASQVRGILERSQAQRARIRESSQSREDAREAMRALHQRTQNAIRGVLTPEQAAELESMREGRRGHGRRGGGPRGR